MARGWRQARPADRVTLFPISDGGDGFGVLVGASLGARTETIVTVNAAHLPCTANWWWEPNSRTAIIEAAQANGLARLPAGKHHPFDLDTFGLGAVIASAHAKGARHCLVGIGGSATNDGGFGVAHSLGWTFFGERGATIERWTELHSLSRCQPPKIAGWPDEMLVAVDVQNPLLGPTGSSRIYGPQKGLREEDFDLAERCLGRLADVMESQSKPLQNPALDRSAARPRIWLVCRAQRLARPSGGSGLGGHWRRLNRPFHIHGQRCWRTGGVVPRSQKTVLGIGRRGE